MNQNLEICVKKIQQCQGQHNVWIAGAWLGNGFHESGFQSGKWAAQSITKKL
jgi:predicted NAD/FAD-binding protein